MVITGRKMLRIIAVLTVVAAAIFVVVSLARGVPIIEIFTDNLSIWGGTAACLIITFLVSDEKKDKKDDQ